MVSVSATRQSFRRERLRPLEFDPNPGVPDPALNVRSLTLRAPQIGVRSAKPLPHKTVVELYGLQGGRCFNCRKEMLPTAARLKSNGKYDRGWTREHLVPRALGGKNGRNIVLCCRGCNAQKADRQPTELELHIANLLHNGVPFAEIEVPVELTPT